LKPNGFTKILQEVGGFFIISDIKNETSKEENDTEKITPKEKTLVKGLFLLSVLAKNFSSVSTCHSPKGNDWLDPEEYEPSIEESSHSSNGGRKWGIARDFWAECRTQRQHLIIWEC
jgi:hypothetical protein